MFGISGGEFFVLLLVCAVVLGPKNVAQGMHALRGALQAVRGWSTRLRSETGIGADELGLSRADLETLKSLDLAKYDPRQMVREAVREEVRAWMDATDPASPSGKDPTEPAAG